MALKHRQLLLTPPPPVPTRHTQGWGDVPVGAKHDLLPVYQHVFITEGTRQAAEGQFEAQSLEGSDSDVLQPQRSQLDGRKETDPARDAPKLHAAAMNVFKNRKHSGLILQNHLHSLQQP